MCIRDSHSTVTIGIEFFESNINAYYTTVVWHRLRVIFHIKNYEIFTGGCTYYQMCIRDRYTLKNTSETTNLTVTKKWDDANDQDGIRQNAVITLKGTVTLPDGKTCLLYTSRCV